VLLLVFPEALVRHVAGRSKHFQGKVQIVAMPLLLLVQCRQELLLHSDMHTHGLQHLKM
jgi:hypothetical protein